MANLTSTRPSERDDSPLNEMCHAFAPADIIEEQFGITATDDIRALRDHAHCIGDYKLARLCTEALG